MADTSDWSMASWEGHRRQQHREFQALPLREKLAIVEQLFGADAVMCQLATDTPLLGSTTQDIHRDTLPLFPETGDRLS